MKIINIIIKIIILVSLSSVYKSHGQSSFNFTYSTLSDEMALTAVETPDGGFIVAAKTGSYLSSTYDYNTLLIKLSPQGDTIKTKSFVKSDGYCLISQLVKSDDGNFLGIGKQQSPSGTSLWLLKINSDLQILLDKTYAINLMYAVYFFGFIDQNSNLIMYGSASDDLYHPHPYIYRMTQSGDSLSYRYFPDSNAQYVFSMIDKPGTAGYYMMISGQYQVPSMTGSQILSFNNDLDVVAIDTIASDLQLYFNVKGLNNHEFILTGKKDVYGTSQRTDLLGIKKMDTLFIWQKSSSLGPIDTVNYPAYYRNLDFTDTNNIYYGGICNQAIAEFSPNKSYYLIGKFDSELNLKWQKYFGGDMYYSLWGVTATSDGGCLLTGAKFNYLTQNMERDICVIKTNPDGIITTAGNKPESLFHDVMVYPNPGTDHITVESGPQVYGGRINFLDLNGNLVINQQIDGSPRLKVNVKSLVAGAYIWRVLKMDKVIDSGKWIKRENN